MVRAVAERRVRRLFWVSRVVGVVMGTVLLLGGYAGCARVLETLPDAYWRDRVAVRFTPGALTQEQQDELLIHIDTYYKRYSWRASDQATPGPWSPGADQPCPS